MRDTFQNALTTLKSRGIEAEGFELPRVEVDSNDSSTLYDYVIYLKK